MLLQALGNPTQTCTCQEKVGEGDRVAYKIEKTISRHISRRHVNSMAFRYTRSQALDSVTRLSFLSSCGSFLCIGPILGQSSLGWQDGHQQLLPMSSPRGNTEPLFWQFPPKFRDSVQLDQFWSLAFPALSQWLAECDVKPALRPTQEAM